jgi:hypothetical protein
MTMTFGTAQWIVRICGILALIFGLLLWAGDLPLTLLPVHILLGVLVVLGLWLLAAVSSQMGIPLGMAAGAALIGVLVLIVGFTQDSLLPGGAHWIMQLLHLILGMAAVASGEMIGGRLRRARLADGTA